MDADIRILLFRLNNQNIPEEEAKQSLEEAYQLLKSSLKDRRQNETLAIGLDVLVMLAETAIQYDLLTIGGDCLQTYLELEPPISQFLGRAYLAQAKLLAPKGSDNPDELEKPVAYLRKAIDFAKQNKKYHFLVYNATVIYFQMTRPFMKENFKQFLIKSLPHMLAALDDIRDTDYAWRASLMQLLLEAYIDAGYRKEAAQLAESSTLFIQKHCPECIVPLFRWMVLYNILPNDKLSWYMRNHCELTLTFKYTRIKQSILLKEADQTSIGQEMQKFHSMLVGEAPILPATAGGEKASKASTAGGGSVAGAGMVFDKKAKKLHPLVKSRFLLKLARLALEQGMLDLSRQCLTSLEDPNVEKTKETQLFAEFVRCDLLVRQLGAKQESYSPSVVELRLQAIQRCMESVSQSVRDNLPPCIETGCGTLWNLCLPLMQHNLRQRVKKPLLLIADTLESLDSLLFVLRCQAHLEVAKCFSDEEQIQTALEHLQKAHRLDDYGEFKEHIAGLMHRLELRQNLYEPLTRPEDQAGQIIEQARSSFAEKRFADAGAVGGGGGTAQSAAEMKFMKRSLLSQVGVALAPESFLYALDAESQSGQSEAEVEAATAVATTTVVATPIQHLASKVRHYDVCIRKADGHVRRLGAENDRERAALWTDLVKIARAHEIWDVCRVASRFCLLYDDNRWKNPHAVRANETLDRRGRMSRGGGGGAGSGQPAGTVLSDLNQSTDTQATEGGGGGSGNVDHGSLDTSITASSAAPAASKKTMGGKKRGDAADSRPGSPTRRGKPNLQEKHLVRMLAEVHFIQAEALIHLLRSSHGVQLNEFPAKPRDRRKHAKNFVPNAQQEQRDAEEWKSYCDWLLSTSQSAMQSFVRAAQLGVELNEAWIVHSAGAYLWNYSKHLLQQTRHAELVKAYVAVLECFPKVGFHSAKNNAMELYVQMTGIVVHGLLLPWLPSPPQTRLDSTAVFAELDASLPTTAGAAGGGDANKKKAPGSPKGKGGANDKTPFQLPPEGVADVKKALDICQFSMDLMNAIGVSMTQPPMPGEELPNTAIMGLQVGLQHRMVVCQLWVQCKQLLTAPVGRGLGVEDSAASGSGGNTNSNTNQGVAASAGGSLVSGDSGGGGSLISPAEQLYANNRAMVRAIVAVEMLWLNRNGAAEMKDTPSFNDGDSDSSEQPPQALARVSHDSLLSRAINLVDNAPWSDLGIALQLYTCLALMTADVANHNLIQQITQKALDLEERVLASASIWESRPTQAAGGGHDSRTESIVSIESSKSRFSSVTSGTFMSSASALGGGGGGGVGGVGSVSLWDSHRLSMCREMLALVACVRAQSVLMRMQGKATLRWQALDLLQKSAEYANACKNYTLVIRAARYYWNASLPLADRMADRIRLQKPLQTLLKFIERTTDRKLVKKYFESHDSDEEDLPKEETKGSKPASIIGLYPPVEIPPPSKEQLDQDLNLRATMYGLVFQAFADQRDWKEGLKAMDSAIHSMPRTKHRLVIFRHRVLTKAKLGQSVEADVQKFRDEPEEFQAELWRLIALSSRDPEYQLQAYLNAISALTEEKNDSEKVKLLLELSQWMFVNGMAAEDCLSYVNWAVDIVLSSVSQSKDPIAAEDPGSTGKNKPAQGAAGKSNKPPAGTSAANSKKPGTLAEGKEKQTSKSSVLDAKTAKRNSTDRVAATTTQHDNKKKHGGIEHVPIKEPVIGLPDSRLAALTTLKEISNVRQLNQLINCFVIGLRLATSARLSELMLEFIILIEAVVKHLWRVLVTTATGLAKDMAKNASKGDKDANKNKANLPAGGKKEGKENAGLAREVKERPKRKGPLDWLPNNIEEWATYDFPEELVSVVEAKEVIDDKGLTSSTIPSPGLLVGNLLDVVDMMRQEGFTTVSLPLLALCELLTRLSFLDHRPTNVAVHFKCMEVCLELNLHSAVQWHERFIGEFAISGEEIAEFREFIIQWKERQMSERISTTSAETLAAAKVSFSPVNDGSVGGGSTSTTRSDDVLPALDYVQFQGQHLYHSLHRLWHHRAWLQSARSLWALGHYTQSRAFLAEVRHIAETELHREAGLLADIYHLEAKLAYSEGRWAQAVNAARQAQALRGADEDFWFDTTLIISKSLFRDDRTHDGRQLAVAELQKAVHWFQRMTQQWPSVAWKLVNLKNQLLRVMWKLQRKVLQDQYQQKKVPMQEYKESLNSFCRQLSDLATEVMRQPEQQEEFVSLILRDLSGTHLQIARLLLSYHDRAVSRMHLLRSYEAAKLAVSLLDAQFGRVNVHLPLWQVGMANGSLSRAVGLSRLRAAEVGLLLLSEHEKEVQEKKMQEEMKDECLKIVEAFVKEEFSPSLEEQRWMSELQTLVDRTTTYLQEALPLLRPYPQWKVKCLYLFARCLRLFALCEDPDVPRQWNAQNLAGVLPGSGREEAKTRLPLSEEENPSRLKNMMKLAATFDLEQRQFQHSLNCLGQVEEILLQALYQSLALGEMELCAQISVELLECSGQLDVNASLHMLSLFASCSTASVMRRLLYQALRDVTVSQTATCLRQIHHLGHNYQCAVGRNMTQSVVFKNARSTLAKTSLAWKYSTVFPQHFDILRDLPSQLTPIIVQHSSWKELPVFVYAGIVDRSKFNSNAGKGAAAGKAANASTGHGRSQVVRFQVNEHDFQQLLDSWSEFRKEIATTLLRHEYKCSQLGMRQQLLRSIDESSAQDKVDYEDVFQRRLDDEIQSDVLTLEHYYTHLVEQMGKYLQPVIQMVADYMRPPGLPGGVPGATLGSQTGSCSPTTAAGGRQASGKSIRAQAKTSIGGAPNANPTAADEATECLVLLLDTKVSELPVEALRELTDYDSIMGVSRDFSLQLLQHRMRPNVLGDEDLLTTGGAGNADGNESPSEKKRTADKKAPIGVSRIPGLRDASKKQNKIIGLQRQIPSGYMPLDCGQFRYIVDAHTDCSATEPLVPSQCFQTLISQPESRAQQFTPRWLGVVGGTDHEPSPAEWEIYLREGSAFLHYGTESCLNDLPLQKVINANLMDCQMVALFDSVQTSKSVSRLSEASAKKNAVDRALEGAVNTALYFTMAGVKSIWMHSWNSNLEQNFHQLKTFMSDCFEEGKSLGQHNLLQLHPHKRIKPSVTATVSASAAGEVNDNNTESDTTGQTEFMDEEARIPLFHVQNQMLIGLPNVIVTVLS